MFAKDTDYEDDVTEYFAEVTDVREYVLPPHLNKEPWAEAAQRRMLAAMPECTEPPPTTKPVTFTWSRIARETDKSYHAFRVYLDLPSPRTVIGAYQKVSGNADAMNAPGPWWRWNVENHWLYRSYAYDTYKEHCAYTEAERKAYEQLERSRRFALKTIKVSANMAQILAERVAGGINGLNPKDIRVSSVPAILRAAAALAKQAYD